MLEKYNANKNTLAEISTKKLIVIMMTILFIVLLHARHPEYDILLILKKFSLINETHVPKIL